MIEEVVVNGEKGPSGPHRGGISRSLSARNLTTTLGMASPSFRQPWSSARKMGCPEQEEGHEPAEAEHIK